MGEAANKITSDDSKDRVTELRTAIASKREQITAEISELKRRREQAVRTSVKTGRAVGIAAIGVLCLASLVNAIADLFRDESDVQDNPDEHPVRSDLSATLAGFAMTALKVAASQYLQHQLQAYTQRAQEEREATPAYDI